MKKLIEIIRKNPFYTTYMRSAVRDCRFYIDNFLFWFSSYNAPYDSRLEGNTVYFIIDKEVQHSGLLDFFKAVVGTYYIARENNFDFKIVCEKPFYIYRYLEPNQVDWTASEEDLRFNKRQSRPMSYNGEGKVPRLDKRVRQYHVRTYVGFDILKNVPGVDAACMWRKLYLSLFRPNPYFQQTIETQLLSDSFIALHLRFVNALEQNESNEFPPLSPHDAESIIERCLGEIEKVIHEYPGQEIKLFTDSNTFMQRAQHLPVHISSGKTGHIAFTQEDDVIEKSYRDFYVISHADKVIRFYADEMYVGAFSEYAAILGNIPCETRLV